MTILVRERPPFRLHATIETPDGTTYRWGQDEPDPQNAPSGITFSSTMPGGFEQAGLTLPRKPEADYPDLAEFSKLTVRGAGGEVAWQGRIESTPRTSGSQLAITPGAVGYQSALTDNNGAREIYIDCDLTQWGPDSVQRQINLISLSIDYTAPAVSPDPTAGAPSLATAITGAWSRSAVCEAMYDSQDIGLHRIDYAWKKNANVNAADANWSWSVQGWSDSEGTSSTTSGSLRATGPGTGTLFADQNFGIVQQLEAVAAGSANLLYALYWTYLAGSGRHGLTIRGTLTATGGLGVYASDVIAHAVGKYAPELATSDAVGDSTIEATSFIIPQLVFKEATTAANIVQTVTQYGLEDYWVDEGPTFHLASRDNHGRDWQARIGSSGLQETGPQVDQIFNGAIVAYTDTAGAARTVGPPGSGANTEDSRLYDSDPANPATAAGIVRNSPPIQLGISAANPTTGIPEAAVKVGQAFLIFQKQASTAGQASLAGYVADSAGVAWPSWAVRAGDRITFVDAHDPVPRRIVRASYDDASRTCQIDLDSPPQGLQVLLARIASGQAQGLA